MEIDLNSNDFPICAKSPCKRSQIAMQKSPNRKPKGVLLESDSAPMKKHYTVNRRSIHVSSLCIGSYIDWL